MVLYNMKRLTIPLILIILTSCAQNQKRIFNQKAIDNKRNAILEEHGFFRDHPDAAQLELLTGNREMGGLAAFNGLGVDSIYCSDLWANPENRVPLQGVRLALDGFQWDASDFEHYSQKLSLKNGIVETQVRGKTGFSYQSKIFFSAREKRLLVVYIKNTSQSQPLTGHLRLSEADFKYANSWPDYDLAYAEEKRFRIESIDDHTVMGVSADTFYTPGAWCLKSSGTLGRTTEANFYSIRIEPGSEQYYYFSFVTQWQQDDYVEACRQLAENAGDYPEIEAQHEDAWAKDWANTPLLILPDKRHEKLFYQSVFWLFCTSASEHFLPGESQFAATCWNMRPFTYGAAGWAALAYIQLGQFENAQKMLHQHFKPGGLIENAKLYIENSGEEEAAFSFAHEARTDGRTTTVCDEQRHLNGFALAMFHKYYIMTGDSLFLNQYLYPVARGIAEFWRQLALWNDDVNAWTFPKLRSVSEDLFEESLLDIVLSAKWSFETAIHYSELTGQDAAFRSKWVEVLNQLYIPENDNYYLEFLGDTEERDYQSYQGIRAPVYLGYPTCELSKTLNAEKAENTLKHAWHRNHEGRGMLGFIANWYALAAQTYGLGNLALEMAEQNFNCYDPSGIALCEGPHNRDRIYFLTTTASYVLVPLNMLVQKDRDGIVPFAAMPDHWKEAAFYNVPAGDGLMVSGEMKNGLIHNVCLTRDDEIVYQTKSGEKIKLDF